MDNGEFLRELKFGVGDGILNFYMYNYHIMSGDKPFSVSSINIFPYLTCYSLNSQHNLQQSSYDLNKSKPHISKELIKYFYEECRLKVIS